MTSDEYDVERMGLEVFKLHGDARELLIEMIRLFSVACIEQKSQGLLDPTKEHVIDLETDEGVDMLRQEMEVWMPFLSWVGTEWVPRAVAVMDDGDELVKEATGEEALNNSIFFPRPKNTTMN